LDEPPTLPECMDLWRLARDGEPFSTATSILAPVRYRGAPAMLKLAATDEERRGGELMVWWRGRGAARVLEHSGGAILLERATGGRSLTRMAQSGDDDAATRILCATAAILHAKHSAGDPPPLTPLTEWFAELLPHASDARGFYSRAARLAERLLANQRETVVLHGDLHHGNVLDFGASGWRAIDPKHVTGDRAFDFANILCNPEADVAVRSGRVHRQTEVIASTTGIEADRLLAWTVAWCGLSATWEAQAGRDADHTVFVGLEAERLLG
jgi:streptomycin 6-kinase